MNTEDITTTWCGNCAFFQPLDTTTANDEVLQIGECRFAPPELAYNPTTGLDGAWPWVRADHWCGRYQPDERQT